MLIGNRADCRTVLTVRGEHHGYYSFTVCVGTGPGRMAGGARERGIGMQAQGLLAHPAPIHSHYQPAG